MRLAPLALVSLLACTQAASAQEADTLGKIKRTGSISIGHRESAAPFSYVNAQHKPAGYTIDLCMQVVDAIKKSLALPDLKIHYVMLSATDRQAKISDGTVDLECGATSNMKERAKTLAFSNTIFYADTKILVRADSGIKSIDDLKEKRVVLTQGAVGATMLSKMDAQKGLKIQYIRSHENSESFKLLEERKVDAFVHDDIQLAMFAAKSDNPKAYLMLDSALSRDPIAIAMRKGDAPLEKVVNGALDGAYKSGEFQKIYAKWFITPKFKFPMGDAMKEILNHPNNTPTN
jgi:glutamate/aspartate transport system substrate-binding protein